MAPDLDDTRLGRLYRDGTSIRGIAAVSGHAPKTVHRRLEAAGIPRRPPGGGFPRQARRVPFTHAQENEIIAAYQAERISLDDLGARYERSGDTIRRLLRRRGEPIRPRGRTLATTPVPPKPEVLRLHGQGWPPRDIARQTGEGTAADIARQLRRAGLTPHTRRPLPPPGELAVAYARAGTLRALGRETRISEDRLKDALAAAGVPAGSLRHVPVAGRPEVARLAAAGATPAQIAGQTGINAAALQALRPPDPGRTQPAAAA